jgi:hypothetical protein
MDAHAVSAFFVDVACVQTLVAVAKHRMITSKQMQFRPSLEQLRRFLQLLSLRSLLLLLLPLLCFVPAALRFVAVASLRMRIACSLLQSPTDGVHPSLTPCIIVVESILLPLQ